MRSPRTVKALETSKLASGSRRGSEALYRLPWYAIIGPPASGPVRSARDVATWAYWLERAHAKRARDGPSTAVSGRR